MTQESFTSLEMLEKLVAFDTTSSNSNMNLIRFVMEYLSAHGVTSQVIANEDQSKANLFATIGPSTGGGIGLSGHTDVVPAHAEDWTGDPFVLREEDGKVFGRGTCDMKGFIAAVLVVPVVKETGAKLRNQIAVGSVDLDAIEPSSFRANGAHYEILDQRFDFGQAKCPSPRLFVIRRAHGRLADQIYRRAHPGMVALNFSVSDQSVTFVLKTLTQNMQDGT